MKKVLNMLLLFLFAAGTFLAGSWYNQHKTSTPTQAAASKPLYYVDPMHPAYKSDKPGIAPDCGMQLEPVYADGRLTAAALQSPLSPGSVRIDPARQQLFGVRVAPVEKISGSDNLRLLGRVAADEGRVYKLNAGIEGYIQDVSAATTGSFVRKNQVLATFSAPNASMTLQTFVLNLGAEDRFKKSAADGTVEGQSMASVNANIQLRTQQLQNLGMSTLQMDEIRQTRQIPDAIKIVSPVDGFVAARNVSPGQKFERDTEWFRIADLRRVWVLADVFESDAQYLRPGMPVRINLPSQKKAFQGRVSNVLPQFDAAARTFKARIEVENQGYLLRPDMFVDVDLPVTFPHTIVVPAGAVLDSGLKKTVFVERGEGLFSARTVETGRRFDDRVEIVKGLQAGERIVVSGNFLVSSESRLKEAAEMYAPADAPPVVGPNANTAASGGAQKEVKKTGPARSDQPLPTTSIASHRGRRRG
ncbi:MAG TPA: efflux RND transporter periplasmic adaptor subunit [Candidatus Angelobacter sp.]|nr:efflux RND transporter periplasmic adaptor subunit [Candidatus Angelobacter sp.]